MLSRRMRRGTRDAADVDVEEGGAEGVGVEGVDRVGMDLFQITDGGNLTMTWKEGNNVGSRA